MIKYRERRVKLLFSKLTEKRMKRRTTVLLNNINLWLRVDRIVNFIGI